MAMWPVLSWRAACSACLVLGVTAFAAELDFAALGKRVLHLPVDPSAAGRPIN